MAQLDPGHGSSLAVLRHQTARLPDDDFFCLRFQVWYPSIDCAVRTRFKTCGGCLKCEQGRFNLQRHRHNLPRIRFSMPDPVE